MTKRNYSKRRSIGGNDRSNGHRPYPRGLGSRRVLVTGGAGFIGANLVRLLLERNYRVTVLDNFSTGQQAHLDGLSVEIVKGDILNRELVVRTVAHQDAVVHLAAQTGVPGSLRNPQKDCETNVVGTLNILDACRTVSAQRGSRPDDTCGTGPRFIFASSNAPLGRQSPPASEDKAPLPISPYGASKLAGEAYCLAYHGSWGLGTVALRFGNVYGPFSAHKGSVVAKFFKDLSDGRDIIINGDGKQTRDFIYVGDLCRAILLAIESDDVCGEVFQVATGIETSIGQLADLMKLVSGSGAKISHGPARQADIRQNYSAIRKIQRVLGWELQVDLRQGLQLTKDWLDKWASLHPQMRKQT